MARTSDAKRQRHEDWGRVGLIDVHGHVVLEGTMGAAGPACGPEIGAHDDGTPWFRVGDYRLDGVPYRGSLFMEVDLRLAAMDEAGIRVQALSPNPLTYLHFIDVPNARDYCRRHNDDLSARTLGLEVAHALDRILERDDAIDDRTKLSRRDERRNEIEIGATRTHEDEPCAASADERAQRVAHDPRGRHRRHVGPVPRERLRGAIQRHVPEGVEHHTVAT